MGGPRLENAQNEGALFTPGQSSRTGRVVLHARSMRPTRRSLLGLLLVLPGTSALGAAPGDDWLGPDKAKHFAACTVLAGAGHGGGALLFEGSVGRWLTGAGLAMGAGLGKELYDTRSGGSGFSGKDLAWDAVGTATGLGVAYLVDRFVFGRGTSDEGSPPVTLRPVASLVLDGREAPLVSGGLGPREVAPGVPAEDDGSAPLPAGHEGRGLFTSRVPGGRGTGASRLAFDELHQLLALKARVHHQHGATPAVTAGDEHGDLSARALVHAAGGEDADLLGQAALGEGALEPARQVQTPASRASAHEALAADEDFHLPRRFPRSVPAVVLHPSSSASVFPAPLPSSRADAPLRGP